MTLKRKLSLILIIPVLLAAFILYIFIEKDREKKETTQIFEIQNTQEIYKDPDSKTTTVRKHFMIVKPPEDLNELKALIEEFYKNNPINSKVIANESKSTDFEIYFYRKSKKLPGNWKPNEGYFETDRLEHHKNDLIATIFWSDSDQHKNYSVMRKSTDKNNYGVLTEEIDYIDDKITDHELRNGKE